MVRHGSAFTTSLTSKHVRFVASATHGVIGKRVPPRRWKEALVARVDTVMSQPTDLPGAGPRAGVRGCLRVCAHALATVRPTVTVVVHFINYWRFLPAVIAG